MQQDNMNNNSLEWLLNNVNVNELQHIPLPVDRPLAFDHAFPENTALPQPQVRAFQSPDQGHQMLTITPEVSVDTQRELYSPERNTTTSSSSPRSPSYVIGNNRRYNDGSVLPISTFDNRYVGLPGYSVMQDCKLSKHMGRRLNQGRLQHFSLGPLVPLGQHFAVATNDYRTRAKTHSLMICDSDVLTKRKGIRYELGADPIVGHFMLPAEEHVRDLHRLSLSGNQLIAATGQGNVMIFDYKQQDNQFLIERTASEKISDAYTRELAVTPDGSCFFSAGFDKGITMTSINAGSLTPVRKFEVDDTIGSLSVGTVGNEINVTGTMDKGTFFLYDPRSNSLGIRQNVGLPQLFCHEFISDYLVLLGFGDGALQMRDTRMMADGEGRFQNWSDPALLQQTEDPYCDGIGQIKYNPNNQTFVTSGYTDFSVWNVQNDGTARIWSHKSDGMDPCTNNSEFTINATYLDDDTILTASAKGVVGVYMQDWES